MQRIKQTKQDFIVLLSETKETLDEQLAPVSYTHLTLPTTPYV